MDSDNPEPAGVPGLRPLNPALRLEAEPYRPDGGCPASGLVLLSALVTGGAIGLGYAVSWVGQWVYLILVFPFLFGLGLGVVGALGVYLGKVRNPALATLAGVLGGLLALGAMHSFDYERFRVKVQEKPRLGRAPGGVRKGADIGFWEYLDLQARRGVLVELRRIHFRLPYALSLIYWLTEVAIVGGVTAYILRSCASEPFCTECFSWKEKRPLGALPVAPATAERIFSSGEIVRLADHDFNRGTGQVRLAVSACPGCGTDAPVEVKLDQVTVNAKGEEEVKELAHLTYPGKALPVLESLFKPPEEAEAAPAEKEPV